MSRETRVIRPFVVDSALEKVFDGARLRFGDLECGSGATITVEDTSTYTLRRAQLIWTEDRDFEDFKRILATGAIRSGFHNELLSIVVTAYTSFLRITDVVYRQPLGDLDSLPRVVDLTGNARPRALQASNSGADVGVYLVLSEEHEPRPLRPRRKGTWLAQTRFRIRTSGELTLFRPQPLTDEIRRELQLPARTARYLHMGDHNPTEPYGNSAEPVFYVDDDLLSELAARPKSPIGIMLQSQLVVDVVTAVVTASASHDEAAVSVYEDIEESLLGRVIRLIAPKGSHKERNRLLRLIREDPAGFVSRVEDMIDVRKAMLDSLRGEQR